MRMYNGCPDRELQEVIDARKAAERRMKSVAMELLSVDDSAICTYFPMEQKYMCLLNYISITGFFDCKIDACNEGIRKIKEIKKTKGDMK